MAFDNDTQQQIQRYLDGEMSASEQQAFEQKIAADETLAQEIVLQKDISSLLADTPENALRKNLQTLSDQHKSSSSSGRSWKNFIWLTPLLLVFGIWFFSSSPNDGSEEISTSTPSEIPSTPVDSPSSPLKIDTLNLQFTNPDKPKEKTLQPIDNQKSKSQKTPKKDSTKAPVYADKTKSIDKNEPIEPPMIMAAPSLIHHDFFAPLPLLDSLISENFQSKNFQITIQKPLPDTLSLEEASKSKYPFITTLSLSTPLTNLVPNIGLYLYPNHAFYWKEDHPWDFTAAKVKEININTYQIQLTPNLNLEPGLYYYALRSSKEGEVFFVSKLTIVE